MTTLGYIRVSTNEQANTGVSLKAQEEKIRGYCELYNYDLVEIVKDPGLSAKNLNRPGVQKVLEAIKAKSIDAIIVMKLDRLTRSVRDLANIIELTNKKNVAMISVEEKIDGSTSTGKMLIHLIGVFSEFERNCISDRTKIAMQYKKSKGEVVGEIPFGFKRTGNKLIKHPGEQKTIQTIKGLRAFGYSFRQIATELREQSIKTKRGGIWQHQQVKRILKAAA